MRTPKEKAEEMLVQIQKVANARIRPMMGEYLLYIDDKLAGQINHSDLFIKVTPYGDEYGKDLSKEPPYDGAKLAFVVPQDKIDNLDWLKSFLAGTVKEL